MELTPLNVKTLLEGLLKSKVFANQILFQIEGGVGKLEQKVVSEFKVDPTDTKEYKAAKPLRGMIRWMGDAIDKAAEQETSEKEMAGALESTGREVDKNAKHFKEYASELQQATTFGDEQILSAQALMISAT